MTKKIGLILIIVFTPAIFPLLYYGIEMYIPLFVFLVVSFSTLVPFGFALIAMQSKTNTLKRIYLAISIILIGAALTSRFFYLPGAGTEFIAGILWFSFAYSPVELKHKYQKWLPYSKNKYESLLLSSIDYISFSSIAIGYMFKIQRWPGGNAIFYSGLMLLVVGLLSWNFKFKKEVVRRKEAEDKIHEQFTEIQDSINYAKRIQKAILPSEKMFSDAFKNFFIYYSPKDIVAGDFYWMVKTSDATIFAVADCTGHGVPGALVSVVCNNSLNRSIREYGCVDPGKILDKTREIVIEEFEKSGEDVKDGMDISLCSLSADMFKWSGANNPLWIIRKDSHQLEEIKADKQPIGKYASAKPFTTHQIELKVGDTIYIFTDGFQDQFGGLKQKKFKALQLKELLLANQKLTMNEQKKLLIKTFENWRGPLEQIDDVCVIGIRM